MRSLKERWRRWYNGWQADWVADWPSRNARLRAWFDMMVFDHGILRLLWSNFAKVTDGIYRANQPGPARVKAWGAKGIKSIINLRGASDWGSYHLEKEAAEATGIELIDQR
ncbi:MAG: protein tyrosine phosphatase, partial [Pseudomonadota bacterium]